MNIVEDKWRQVEIEGDTFEYMRSQRADGKYVEVLKSTKPGMFHVFLEGTSKFNCCCSSQTYAQYEHRDVLAAQAIVYHLLNGGGDEAR